MSDPKQAEQPELAKTQEMPAMILPTQEDDEHFRAEQDRIKEMSR